MAGNISSDESFRLAKMVWRYTTGNAIAKNIPAETAQNESRLLEVQADVPVTALYKLSYARPVDKSYFASDLLSDILSAGRSSRLYHPLVKEKKVFSEISAYVTSSIDPVCWWLRKIIAWREDGRC